MSQVRIALVSNVCIWAVFFIFALLIPVSEPEQEKKVFGEMSIRLEPLPQVSQQESFQSETQEVVQQEKSVIEQDVPQVQDYQEEPLTQTPVEQSQVTMREIETPAPETRRPQTLSKSIEELMAEQNSRQLNSSEPQWTEDIFSSNATVSSNIQSQTSNTPLQSSTSLSGSAASSSEGNTSSLATSQGASQRSGTTASSVSAETSSLLSGISSAQNSQVSTQQSAHSSQSFTTENNTQNNTTGYNISFDGVPRKLLHPVNPVLEISRENQRLIDAKRNVTVTLTVSANGTVSPSSVTFTPSVLVPAQIQSELRQQIAQWRFEEGSSSGHATFFYSIIVE